MNLQDVFEVIFNIVYLVVIWGLVAKMHTYTNDSLLPDRRLLKVLTWTFALLALGDTGHVGFRVAAYLFGGIDANLALVGFGKLMTSVTITIFYMLLIVAWRIRYQQRLGVFAGILLMSGVFRLFVLACPANNWGAAVTPFTLSMYRNIPLWMIGLGVVYLFLTSGLKAKDAVFQWMAYMILCSHAFYTPVILYAHKVPAIGALMIPKTIAYIAVAFIAYYGIFKTSSKVIVQA